MASSTKPLKDFRDYTVTTKLAQPLAHSRNRQRWGQWKINKKTSIQNMAYAQQIQKQETKR